MRLVRSAPFLLAVSFLLVPFRGSSQKPEQQAPVIRATTRLVEVTVVVQDKSGNPITGLKPEDFVLTDNGKPQAIAMFAVEDATRAAAAAPPPKPLPPNVFVNRPTQRGGVLPGATVVLLDGLNTRLRDQGKVRENVLKFLRKVPADAPVALYALDSKVRLLQEFTQDPAILMRAFEEYKPQVSAHRDEYEAARVNTTQAFEEFVKRTMAFDQREADFHMEQTVRATADALETIGRHLAGVPGRKSLIWVSGSFPIGTGQEAWLCMDINWGCADVDSPAITTVRISENPNAPPKRDPAIMRDARNHYEQVERAARALTDADVAVYPVDARGALDVWDIDPTLNRPTGSVAGGIERGGLLTVERTQGKEQTMRVLADETGGRPFNNHDLATAVRRAVDDGRVTYTLAYYPNHGQWDGKFRRIKVEVKRPGAHLMYRRGYFAAGTTTLQQEQRAELLAQELGNPLDATKIALAVRAGITHADGKEYIQASVQLSPRDITFVPAAGGWTGAVDLMFVEMKEDGQVLVSAKGTLDLSVKAEERQARQERPFSFSQRLELMPGAHRVKVIALDAMSGVTGTLTVPLSQISAAKR